MFFFCSRRFKYYNYIPHQSNLHTHQTEPTHYRGFLYQVGRFFNATQSAFEPKYTEAPSVTRKIVCIVSCSRFIFRNAWEWYLLSLYTQCLFYLYHAMVRPTIWHALRIVIFFFKEMADPSRESDDGPAVSGPFTPGLDQARRDELMRHLRTASLRGAWKRHQITCEVLVRDEFAKVVEEYPMKGGPRSDRLPLVDSLD